MMKIRIARATRDFDSILKFYRDGLSLELLGSFNDHEGFDGIMLGTKNAPYHFEFTREAGHIAPRSASKENLIVFYLPKFEEYQKRVDQMIRNGFHPISSHNPYWDHNGKTFEDVDGYRIVLFHGDWG